MAGFDTSVFRQQWRLPETQQNALLRGLETQRAQQGNALQSMQLQALMQRQQQAQAEAAAQAEAEQRRQRYLASVSGQAGPPAEFNPLQAFGAGFKPEEIKALRGTEDQTQVVAPGAAQVRGGKVLFQNQFKPEQTPEALRTLEAIYGKGTPEFQQAARMLAQKMTTHTPTATVVNYGSPVPVQLPDGNVGYVQPSNRGGPAAPMADAGGKPMVKPPEGGGKVPAEIQRMNIAADSMVDLLGGYESWLKKNNPRDPAVQMSAQRRAEMQSMMKNIQLQYKELAALGALTGPDLALIEAALSDPFSFRGAFYGTGGLMAQIKGARELVDVRRRAMAGNTGGAKPTAAKPDADPLGLRGQ